MTDTPMPPFEFVSTGGHTYALPIDYKDEPFSVGLSVKDFKSDELDKIAKEMAKEMAMRSTIFTGTVSLPEPAAPPFTSRSLFAEPFSTKTLWPEPTDEYLDECLKAVLDADSGLGLDGAVWINSHKATSQPETEGVYETFLNRWWITSPIFGNSFVFIPTLADGSQIFGYKTKQEAEDVRRATFPDTFKVIQFERVTLPLNLS